jgi:alkylation response protein AidB-like acyl-CoA dehydrogenase
VDFTFTDDQDQLRSLAKEILSDLATHERLTRLEREQPDGVFDRDLWQRLAESGLTGIAIPEEYGGAGLGLLDLAVVLEEIGRAVAPVPAVSTLVLGALPVARFGTPELRGKLLPGVVDGSLILTAALAEPGEGPPSAPTTVATPDGDGWRLDGEKAFVPYGAEADWILVPAAVEGDRGQLFVVPADAAGITVTPLRTTNREPLAGLTLSGVRPVESLGPEAVDFAGAHGTAAICAVAAGVCAAALAMTAKYTSERIQFDKPIASFQAVGQRAGDAYVDTEIVRLTAYQAIWRLAAGWPAGDEIAVAKFWAGDGGSRVVHAAQHLHGGIGVDLDYPLHRYFLWAKQLEHELGTPTRQLLALGASLAEVPA